MKQQLHHRLRGKPPLSLRPLSVSLLLLSLVVVLHSVSSLGKSFDEESAFGQKRSPVYEEGRIDQLHAENPHKLDSQNPLAKPWGSECGIPDVKPKVDSRIVGGVEATPHSWPWQVQIMIWVKDHWKQWCGGSVLYPHWIITAAHCVNKDGPISNCTIVLGEHDITKQEGIEQEVKIKDLIAHEDHDYETKKNDIALIRLSEDVQFNRYIKPICLPNDDDEDVKDGTLCVATGWGRTNDTGDETVLNQVYLPVINNSVCNQPDWNNGTRPVTDNMICAGYPEGGKSTCQGDSGGPLVSFSKGKWKLFGVTSFGYHCAKPRNPSIFTRVKNYLKWIQAKIKQYD